MVLAREPKTGLWAFAIKEHRKMSSPAARVTVIGSPCSRNEKSQPPSCCRVSIGSPRSWSDGCWGPTSKSRGKLFYRLVQAGGGRPRALQADGQVFRAPGGRGKPQQV